MYLENKSNLEIELSQTSAQAHQGRSSLRSPEAVAGNFGELRLLQGISDQRESQKLQRAAVLPSGQCVIHTENQFVPICQEDGYVLSLLRKYLSNLLIWRQEWLNLVDLCLKGWSQTKHTDNPPHRGKAVPYIQVDQSGSVSSDCGFKIYQATPSLLHEYFMRCQSDWSQNLNGSDSLIVSLWYRIVQLYFLHCHWYKLLLEIWKGHYWCKTQH